ncbi:MAG: UDP-N-acetylmuramoyl-L-alanine--D-glutamate ligase [Bacteroidota bacterium]
MKRLVVLGAAESGVGAAVLARKKGFEVFVSDKGTIKSKYRKVLLKHRIRFEEGKHTEALILNADEVVKSPGIPEKSEMVRKLRRKRVPVISEIEFAARYTDAKLVGITGTNGKTTTTMLTYHIFKKAGLNVGLAGNVGKSFALQVAEKKRDYYVLELSSFQLDEMFRTRINVAILTNITPDHLDRYDYKVSNYVNSKFRITQNQTRADAFIYCADDELTVKALKRRKPKAMLYPFSIKKKIGKGAFVKGNQLTININHKPLTMFLEDLALQGKHNQYNSMAAGIAARVVEIKKEIIKESLSDFENVEHRLEFVARVHGIEFINDSKATNVNSTWYALESMTSPVIWIVGGVDKGNDYSALKDLVKSKVKAIVCLGVDNKKIIKAFKGVVDTIVETSSASEAVKASYKLGRKGDIVLLSPCCASFDLFENYEDRGIQFKKAVRSL